MRLSGRWDGERLRGQAWWPKQSLTVFQPLVPPDWKMNLREGSLYAQVAFSAAAGQGFEAGGHGVLKGGSAWMPDNQINGVDFVLPFRFSDGHWQLGTRRPVSLRIGEIVNQVTARNLTADLQGTWPWSEANPLQLSDVSVDLLGGKLTLLQLRMPQRDPALIRLQHISSSELTSAVKVKQFAMSGAVSGALPLLSLIHISLGYGSNASRRMPKPLRIRNIATPIFPVPITPAVLPYMVKPVRPSREKLASRVRW